MTERKPVGACLLKHTERNYRPKECAACGTMFKPKYPAEKTCCPECMEQYHKQKQKEQVKMAALRAKRKIAEYNKTHRFCEICGKPLGQGNGNRKWHFECVLEKYRQGDKSRKMMQYFFNKGYTVSEINEMAMIATEKE